MISKAMIRRIHSAADRTLTRAGAPYQRWALYIRVGSSVDVVLHDRAAFVRLLERSVSSATDEQAAKIRDIIRRIRANPCRSPELVSLPGDRVELWFATPSDGGPN